MQNHEVAPRAETTRVRSNRNIRSVLVRSVAGVASIAVAATIFACAQDGSTVPTEPAAVVDFARTRASLTAQQAARLDSAMAVAAWAGEAHHAAMQVVISSIQEYHKARRPIPRRGSAEFCDILERAGDAAMTVMDHHRGMGRGRAGRSLDVRKGSAAFGCARDGLSVFGLPAMMPTTSTAAVEYDPEVTGAYEFYLSPMQAAITGSDGSVRNVRSRTYAVVSQAVSDGVPEGDLLALSSFAGVAVSSAEEWNSFDWTSGGGGDGCEPTNGCYAMSVFAMGDGIPAKIKKVIIADGVACLSSVSGWAALKLLLLGPAWTALAGECGLRATLASGAAILALL